VSHSSVLAWITAGAVLMLVAAYGIGAPFLLLRTALMMSRRRRLRYRPANDEVLATSRFTIPVSLVLPVAGAVPFASTAVRRALQFRYPETELIVVTSGAPEALESLRHEFGLSPCELFFRRTLPAQNVGVIYRSQVEPRLLVADMTSATAGDLLNCGANLARYRYICVLDTDAVYEPDSLLEAMQAALEDPSLVVGVTTGLKVRPVDSVNSALDGLAPSGLIEAVRYLAAARTRLLTVGRRRLDLPPGGCPGLTIWRRDSVVDVGGFNGDSAAVHADMTFRMHRHYRGDRRRYRIIHVTEPVGTIDHETARRHMVVAGYVPWSVLWRHKGMTFNPRLGRLGLFDFPRYLFNMVVAPWLELCALALLAAAIPLGVLTAGQLLLVLFILGLGSGVVAMCALLLSGDLGRDIRPTALFNVLLVGPLEYFLTRPALLWSRLTSARP
jgi:poly-beta-1,6-N-acetyl-D-glucosamine synthase